jgi:quinol-cytochrome oxidoreductase complex cytochrome b subunit/coenzyme F420-reducing hydrogenase delta subunit/NAD-dependent dihydropyrimidine dehydrogenase PreA subunit
VKRALRQGLEYIESAFDAMYGTAWNPLYWLGALGWFFFWIIVASGIYLYIFFDSGVHQAYQSLEYLTRTQWYAGGVMRSLHRYASDALVVVVLGHLARQWIKGNYKDARWFGWVTGIPLLWLMYASGISGYWIVWDELAQYVALATTEWLDTLPLFGEPIARNFLHESTLSGRFFTLMVFIHIAVPLMLLFLMWVHIQRHMYPKVNPPRGLMIGAFSMLVVLSLAYPAVSQEPADLNRVVGEVGLDWFYLPLYPLLDLYPGEVLWMVLGAATLVLAVLPFLPPRPKAPPAVVDLDNCNGCGRCVADCPYSAVTLRPRTDGTSYSHEAVVDDAKCVSCGICAGACPTSTPFRRRSALVPGIDLPDRSMAALREELVGKAAGLTDGPRVLVVACGGGLDLETLKSPGVAVASLPCVGQLPPPFIDFLISRDHVDGVFLTGCRNGDCEYRLGQQWTIERLAERRDPRLRRRVPRERIHMFWAGRDRAEAARRELVQFRETLAAPPGTDTGDTQQPGPGSATRTGGGDA